MRKTNILLTKEQRELLERHNKQGRSMAGFIRDIIDAYFKNLEDNAKSI
jgi:predicted DNA-binding protein